MIENFLDNLEHYIKFLPLKGYDFIFLFSLIEALAFIGIFFPGSIVMVIAGFLAYMGIFNFPLLFLSAIVGALIGDLISYYLGKKKGLEIKIGEKSIFKYLYIPEAGEFLLKRRAISIVLGRFMGPTRPFVPFYLGAVGSCEKRFLFYDVIGVLVWSVFYIML